MRSSIRIVLSCTLVLMLHLAVPSCQYGMAAFVLCTSSRVTENLLLEGRKCQFDSSAIFAARSVVAPSFSWGRVPGKRGC